MLRAMNLYMMILHKWQSDSNNSERSRRLHDGIELYSSDADRYGAKAPQMLLPQEDSSAAMYPSDIDSGFTMMNRRNPPTIQQPIHRKKIDEADIVKTDGTTSMQ